MPVKEKKDFIQIGYYVPGRDDYEARIERDWCGQGWVVKDEKAFLLYPDQVCYVPELVDRAYTGYEIRELCNNQEEFAKQCFYDLDWQSPEVWIDEQYRNDEWGWCPHCKKIFQKYGESIPCPGCGKQKDMGA